MIDLSTEKVKYDRLWSGGTYGKSHCPEIKFLERCTFLLDRSVNAFARGKWLIVGSGDGQGFRWLQKRDYDVHATDLSDAVRDLYPVGSFTQCPAHQLPFEDERFSTVLCVDVIEHIPEHLVVPSLSEMIRVCSGRILIQAYCGESEFEPGLHLTVKPAEWWLRTFGSVGGIGWSRIDGLAVSAEVIP